MIIQDPTTATESKQKTEEQKRKDAARKIREFEQSGKIRLAKQPRRKQAQKLSSLSFLDQNFDRDAVKAARSRHEDSFEKQKLNRVLKEMNRMAAREEAAEKLSDVHEIKVNAYGCQNCNMVNENKNRFSYCFQNSHNTYTCKATKRFFQCKQCGKRVETINQKRVHFPCPKCKGDALNFRRAGLKDSGKYRPSKDIHQLAVRGPEDNFSR